MTLDPAPAWQQHAACRDLGPDLFFPDQGCARTAESAKAICGECPVRLQCLEMALTMQCDEHGIFGGCSPKQRRTIRRQRRQAA